jgi:hypothetical protein
MPDHELKSGLHDTAWIKGVEHPTSSGSPMFPLASLSSKRSTSDLGVPTKRNPARAFLARKHNAMTYGQMAISPYVIKSKADPKDAAAFLEDPMPVLERQKCRKT